MKNIEPNALADKAEDLPLSEMAYQAVLNMLLGGELALNELVTERQIAARLGISRTPLREATRRLEGERFLERQKSGALVVRPLPVEEFMQILAVRRVLEGEAVRLAAGHVPKAELEQIRARIREVQALPEDQTVPPEYVDSDRDLHLMIARASGNPVLLQMIEDLRKRTSMVRFGRLPSQRSQVCNEHLAILEALEQGDGEKARDVMQDHINQVRAVVLRRLGGGQ